jgi:hypothetical protein
MDEAVKLFNAAFEQHVEMDPAYHTLANLGTWEHAINEQL